MQGPTDEPEAFFPPLEIVIISGGRNMLSDNTSLRRKNALRIDSWYLTSPPPPHDADTPATKKPRLDPSINSTDSTAAVTPDVIDLCSDSEDEKEKLKVDSPSINVIVDTINSLLELKRTHPITTAAAEAATKTASPDVVIAPAAANIDVDDDDAKNDCVTDSQSNPRATGATWTREEDAELTSAVTNTNEMIWGNTKYRTDWVAIAALLKGRTKTQCLRRWHNFLKASVAQTVEPLDTWKIDEDIKLTSALQRYGGKNWKAAAALLPGRTKNECKNRWNDVSKNSIDQVAVRSGTWTEAEDDKLKDAVHRHSRRDWSVIATMVPGRSKSQCRGRWYGALNPNTALTAGSSGPWTEDEDSKLTSAVQRYGDKNWIGITALVPGRTKKQCRNRWHNALNPGLAARNLGAWMDAEDVKLVHAVQMYCGKNWDAIAALVPDRSQRQCSSRWHAVLKHSIDLTTGPSGIWTIEEDSKLKDAVQTLGSNDWDVIAALIPGRTTFQCSDRWKNYVVPYRSTFQEEEYATFNAASALGQDPYPQY
jgi:hypothetical protein